MHDESPDEVGIFDFEEFANHLLDQGLQASPSQMHGCLSGLLGAGAPAQPEYGLDALTLALDLTLHGELASRLMQLYTTTEAALEDEGFVFYPLLPDDEEEILVRTEALASWCDGFLAGFAFVTAGKEKSLGTLSQDAGEVLRDIAAMAQAEVSVDESEEDAQDSYIELVEYLRVAVVNVFMENRVDPEDQNYSPEPGEPLH